MTGSPAEVIGYQLIYTNVEADLSPTRQRGFQIWLASAELTPDQRRAAAKRLDDFRLPPGADARDRNLARHAYFHLPSGLYGIARTVPSAERDKFGRGGKFHAHAVLLAEDAFRAVGFNPFRVIDSGFRFHDAPADALTGENWRSGQLPAVELRADPTPPETLSVTADLRAELFHHIGQPDDRPIVVADRPDQVLALLREWFAILPPSVRKRVAFDTLSTGASLQETPYAVVGAYSPELLKTWSFRRYHRLEPASGVCSPPLAAPPATFPAWLLKSPDWRRLPDPDRDAVYATVRLLGEGQLDRLQADSLAPPSLEFLGRCGETEGLVRQATRSRVNNDLPLSLAQLPDVQAAIAGHFEGSLAEVLERLRHPLPRKLVAGVLFTALDRSRAAPAPDVLKGLETWLAAGTRIPRLELILQRWRGTDEDVTAIELGLAELEPASDRARWFRDWLAGTLVGRSTGEYLARLPIDRPAPPRLLAEARLWLASLGEPASWEHRELSLVAAFHMGPEVLATELTHPRPSSDVVTWLAQAAAERLRDRYAVGWADDGTGNTYLGLFLVPEQRVDHTLLDALLEYGGRGVARRLAAALRPGSPRLTGAREPDTEPTLPEAGRRHYKSVLEAGPKERAEAVRAFRAYLSAADDETYRLCANLLLQQVAGEATACALDDETYFTGLRLIWVQQSNLANQLGLFEAIAGAAVPEVRIGTVPEVGRPPDLRSGRRFAWLAARLESPVGTLKLRI